MPLTDRKQDSDGRQIRFGFRVGAIIDLDHLPIQSNFPIQFKFRLGSISGGGGGAGVRGARKGGKGGGEGTRRGREGDGGRGEGREMTR